MRFAALRAPWYKGYLGGAMLMMTGDLTEHAITYWVMWQSFHSVPLAGFAVVSHWLPHLLLSIPLGALADRFDCRRIVQVAAALFMSVSVGWAVLIGTGTLQPWHCMVLLIVHGLAAAIWGPAEQLMLYDMVGPEELPGAVRLMATGLNVGALVGPAVGAALLFTVGPVLGLAVNVLIYVPFIVYLFLTPFTGHVRVAHRERVRLLDIVHVLREVPRYPAILIAMVLQGAVAFFVGTAFVPLLPDFGDILGLSQSGLGYGLLLVSMAGGAVIGGITLEAIGRIRVSTRLSVGTGLVFAVAVAVFAVSRSFPSRSWLSRWRAPAASCRRRPLRRSCSSPPRSTGAADSSAPT
ncbi:MFS transporter [Naasia aerilata]|uniref:Major facilitator superfamily (MFS) profile domain-containing protein n=1 Tax=Naasia aerilata TaxID=1162966 RepID=A0ABM8GE56_9MICO|nr:MFS transporter [Naasia aerilata]BDZ46589.1 hypothetical protein GCM10025866_24980 [Naasia aerilata]